MDELNEAFKEVDSGEPVLPESSLYKEYIYRMYEVYMGDD
jgi:hypothetical protein